MSARIGVRQRESVFTKCEIFRAHKGKIIALLFNDSYFARTCETGITFARREIGSVNDLREMRVSRIPFQGGSSRYAITTEETDARPPLDALLPPLFTAIDGVGELIVLHTLPGGAQPIGVALDAEEWPEVMGTIAGDDTVLIVCRSSGAMEKVIKRLKAVAGPTAV